MKIPILKKDESLEESFKKLEEETEEVKKAINKNDRINLAEECLDVIQVCVGMLDKLDKEGLNVRQALLRHEKKLLIERPWKATGWIDFEVFRKKSS